MNNGFKKDDKATLLLSASTYLGSDPIQCKVISTPDNDVDFLIVEVPEGDFITTYYLNPKSSDFLGLAVSRKKQDE